MKEHLRVLLARIPLISHSRCLQRSAAEIELKRWLQGPFARPKLNRTLMNYTSKYAEFIILFEFGGNAQMGAWVVETSAGVFPHLEKWGQSFIKYRESATQKIYLPVQDYCLPV